MKRIPRWTFALLVTSIALNLFLGAFFVARHLMHDRGDARADRYTLRLELRALADSLPDTARDALRATMRAKRNELEPVVDTIHHAREDIIAALAREPFDPADLDAAFSRLSQGLAELQTPVQEVIVESAAAMTPEQRRHMAGALRDSNARHMEHHHRSDRKDGRDPR